MIRATAVMGVAKASPAVQVVLMDVAGRVTLAEGVAGTVTDAGGMGSMGKMG